MKKIFAAAFILSSFSFPSLVLAKDACVPTMSVEQALAQLNAGYAKISQEIKGAYAEAETICNQANAAALAAHTARLQENEDQYQTDMSAIKGHMDLGWREKLAAATAAYNQASRQSTEQYTAETQANIAAFYQAAGQAQAVYIAKGAELSAQYNAAVCAQSPRSVTSISPAPPKHLQ